MNVDEMMMHAMRDAYAYAAKMRAGSLPQEPMRAVLDVLHANGYRRCAEGQKVTQWCDRANKAEAEVERMAGRPTVWAYEQACKALAFHRDRADAAEAEVESAGKDVLAAADKVVEWRTRAEKAEAEVERLKAVIEAAPHSQNCLSHHTLMVGGFCEPGQLTMPRSVQYKCNCWKNAARGES